MRINFYILVINLFIVFFSKSTNKDLFEDKTILILGGTGYLGRALTEEMLKYNPKKVILFSRDEVKHFNCATIFNNNPVIKNIIGDIRDYDTLLKATKSVDIVIHAAALKRIDMLEVNVEESIKTNVIGSLNVFNACIANNVSKVLFVSTDKACLPINTYGACKFISEKIFTNYDRNNIHTKFMIARYGNVLQSTGSVIPTFIDIIKKGEDIPLTDMRMTRFIIDKEEAIALICDALRYGVGGEVFVKRLPAFKVIDLIDILKDKYKANNKLRVVGIRPGEKIHEQLISESEMHRTILFNDYFIILPSTINMVQNDVEVPLYIKKGNIFDVNFADTYSYSSEKAIIAKDVVCELFKKVGLL